MIERDGKKFAYIYYDDFTVQIDDNDYKYIDPVVQEADAIIFDIRENPGGSGPLGLELAGHFMKEETFVGYSTYKSGPGHDDFVDPFEMHVTPSKKYNWADKQTAILTNRGVYSTANLFTSVMKHAPNAIQVGQRSGGGGGLPMTHYLPNGWVVVFASNILLDVDMNHIEPGIYPDYEAEIGDFKTTGKDGIVEKAIEELMKRI
jgi:C-terminal processing protease CtpA/Prc